MATRSTIAVQFQNGTILQSYCHWDGYLEHNGKLLVENYNSEELASALIDLGSISVLAPKINPVGPHTFDEPEKNVTVFYGRDRGEDDTEPLPFYDYEEYKSNGRGEEFNYLFRNGCWECEFDGKVVDVETELDKRGAK